VAGLVAPERAVRPAVAVIVDAVAVSGASSSANRLLASACAASIWCACVARVAGHEDLAGAERLGEPVQRGLALRVGRVVRSSAPPVSATAAVSVSAPVPTGVTSMYRLPVDQACAR
jgi:hypothetical protein